jgi:hypothetical protein
MCLYLTCKTLAKLKLDQDGVENFEKSNLVGCLRLAVPPLHQLPSIVSTHHKAS